VDHGIVSVHGGFLVAQRQELTEALAAGRYGLGKLTDGGENPRAWGGGGNADPIQETFKLSRSGPILLVATRPVHVGHGEVRLPLPIIILRGVGLIRLTLLLVLLGISVGVSVVEGHQLG
jgi:hypothetical protein